MAMLDGPTRAVHPRVGGEQAHIAERKRHGDGSSPRGRGTVLRVEGRSTDIRFIPAWAGNRMSQPPPTACPPVHPRVGGEQGKAMAPNTVDVGSSPRGRGTGH